MKDARFIELVNLYIDRQISAEDTAELESEIQTNAAHRRIYQQYCHMHRASKLVYESFRANAEEPAAGGAQHGSIAYFAQRRQRVRRNYWLGSLAGLAAAACAAVYFGRADVSPSNSAPAAAVAVKAAVPAAKPVAVANVEVVPARTNYPALLNDKHRTDSFAINQNAQVQPVALFDDGVFATPANLTTDARRLAPTKAKTGDQPMAAFQFQR
ncbi:MAG TPA: hypothetical protein VHD32_18945 [Candidatus Didemnitutus sp.]|nr:hypothetical protein [Candidatus Didemnitutus sp.]